MSKMTPQRRPSNQNGRLPVRFTTWLLFFFLRFKSCSTCLPNVMWLRGLKFAKRQMTPATHCSCLRWASWAALGVRRLDTSAAGRPAPRARRAATAAASGVHTSKPEGCPPKPWWENHQTLAENISQMYSIKACRQLSMEKCQAHALKRSLSIKRTSYWS